MSIDPALWAASEAAESWAHAIAGASHFAKQGHVDYATMLLRPLWYDRDYEVHGPILTGARDQLADVSAGLIPHPAGEQYRWFTSAHEAVLDIGSRLATVLPPPAFHRRPRALSGNRSRGILPAGGVAAELQRF